MRGAPALTVPQIVHPRPVVAAVAVLAYIALPPAIPLSPPKTSEPPLQWQYTPLHRAAVNGHEAACRVLVEAGAKVDALDDVSWSCM